MSLGVSFAFSHADATEQLAIGGQPRFLSFDADTREVPLNLYAEMLRDRGLTDMYEIVRINKCGHQRALHWAAFLGLTDATNDGPGTCFAASSPVNGVSVPRFIAEFDKGASVSAALKASGSVLIKLKARRADLTVVPSAVRGGGKLEDVKAWRLGELAKLQSQLEAAAVEFVKRRAEHPEAFAAVIKHYSTDDYRYPPGNLPKKQAAVVWFLRSQGVSKKKAFQVSKPFSGASEPIQATSVLPEEEDKPSTNYWRSKRLRAIARQAQELAERNRLLAIGGAVAGVAIVGAFLFRRRG